MIKAKLFPLSLRRSSRFSTTPLCYSKISRSFLAVTPRMTSTNNAALHSTLHSGHLKPTVSNLRVSKHKGTRISRFSTKIAVKSLRPQKTKAKMDAFEAVLTGKYPAKQHAKRVVQYIKKKNPDATGVLYVEGQKTRMIEDNDESMPFRYLMPPPPSRGNH